jgi:NAD+ kinase
MAKKGPKRIILVGNLNKSEARSLGVELLEWLRDKTRVVAENIHGEVDLKNPPAADFVIILGGDGTILATVREMADNQFPIIGVNIGKLGFLAEFSIAQLKQHFERIISDETMISSRIMLNCRISGPQRKQDYITNAVNELAITAGPPFRMIEVSIAIGQEHLAVCAGDGLVVSTPTGSTAYNLSAGGPILHATLDAAVITPLAAHSLNFRPMVIDLEKPIVLRCRDCREESLTMKKNPGDAALDGNGALRSLMETWGPAVAAVDGQVNVPLKSQDEVVITCAPERFLLVRSPVQSQWRLLSTKLHWGVLPSYNRKESS